MSTKLPRHPVHPERLCWGCTKLCPANDLACGNGSIRAPHPAELFGDDWYEWIEREHSAKPSQSDQDEPHSSDPQSSPS